MPVRARGLLAALAAFAVCVPAHAGGDEGIGVNTRFAGSVAGTSWEISAEVFVHTDERVTGECTYTGQTTTDGLMQYEFAGTAHATSTSTSQPEVTDVTCTLTSPAQGLPGELPTQTASFEVLCPLGNCGTASTVTGWPVRPVVVCVDGYALFGPTPVLRRDITHACKTSTI